MSRSRGATLGALAAQRWILLAFFVSGASSLVFQTLWSRLLQHVFGASSLAISSVVSVFMAGLGLGAFYIGKRADRIRDPLLWYALAEVGVGVASLLVPWVLQPDGWLAAANTELRHAFGVSSPWFVLARFLCIAPVLIVPTFLMGATLPLLARHVVAHSSSGVQASRQVGQLYAVNTFGAVVGVLGSSFVLLPRFGVSVANTSAACTNFALALLVLSLRRSVARAGLPLVAAGASSTLAGAPAAESGITREPGSPRAVRLAAALAFAFSGFASLLYEVVWSRALISTIGGSLYSFALILATFLVGIALGSALASLPAEGETRVRASLGAGVLCVLAAAPMLAQAEGRVGFALAAVSGVACVLVLAWLARDRARRELALDDVPAAGERRRELPLALAVPVLVGLAVCARTPERLSALTLGVVVASSVLLALLVMLRRQPFWLLVALQLFVAAATFMSDLAADELSLTFAAMVVPLYDALPEHVGTVQALMCGTAALCVLPAALGMGAVFPVAMRVFSSGGDKIARDVGVMYTGNTLGSIVGAWLPGFVLMPWLGMQATLHVGIAVNLLVALGLLAAAWQAHGAGTLAWSRKPAPWVALGTCVALGLLAFATLRPPSFLAWNMSRMTLGAFRVSLAREVLDEEGWGEPELVYHRDGLSTTVTVERWGRHYTLKNNGKVDASNGDDMATQIMVAALPLLMHARDARGLDVAVIGFGSGVSVGATLQFPVRDVEVIELERATIEGSRFFADANHLDYVSRSFPYARAERLRVINDDARNHLAATPRRYDVIVSEPSNPWLTGVSDLFTADHFRIAKRKLKPDGVYCQWAQLYELSPDNVKTIYRTFAGAFRHVVVFAADDLSSDTILLGSDSPLPLDLVRVQRAFADARSAAELRRAGVRTPFDVLARVLLKDRAELLAFTRGAAINTDDNARIELAAPRDLIGFERYKGYLQSMYAPSWPYARIADALVGFGDGHAAVRNYSRQALALLAQGRKAQALRVMQRASMHGSSIELTRARAVYAESAAELAEPAPQFVAGGAATPRDAAPAVREALVLAYDSALILMHRGDHRAALQALRAAPEHLRRAAGGEWDYFEGYLRFKLGDHALALELFEALARQDESFAAAHPPLLFFAARSQDTLMRFDHAVRNFLSFVQSREDAGEFVGGDSGSQVPPWVLSR